MNPAFRVEPSLHLALKNPVVRTIALVLSLLVFCAQTVLAAGDFAEFRTIIQKAQTYKNQDASAYARALGDVQSMRSNGQRDLLVPATATKEERTVFVFWRSFEAAYSTYHGQTKPSAPKPMSVGGVTVYTMDQLGQMSQTLSTDEIQKLIAGLNNSNPIIGNSAGKIVATGAGGLIIANGSGHLIGNNGAALANNGDPLTQVTPTTAMVTASFSLPSASLRTGQTVSDATGLITTAFRNALQRDPTAGELSGWTEFIKKYPKSSLTQSSGNLARILQQLAPPSQPAPAAGNGSGPSHNARPGPAATRG
jgi:hypothetical protein